MRHLHAYHVDDGTWRYMVIAANQREACRIFDCSVGYMRQHGGRYQDGSADAEVAFSDPFRVWKKDMRIEQAGKVAPWVYA